MLTNNIILVISGSDILRRLGIWFRPPLNNVVKPTNAKSPHELPIDLMVIKWDKHEVVACDMSSRTGRCHTTPFVVLSLMYTISEGPQLDA